MIRIVDATLREGAQHKGAQFDESASVSIARGLVRLGVDMIECGHPIKAREELRRVQSVVAACGTVPVLAHARARPADIDAVKDSGARWVGIFVGVNDYSKRYRLKRDAINPIIAEAVRYAKSIGLDVRLTIEDASRTPWDELLAGLRCAVESGADRLCFSDTVGALCPWEVEAAVGKLVQTFPGCPLEVHLHDDRGMADANALCAVRAGAQWVSSSINGIGERCGIVDTLLLLANLDCMTVRPMVSGDHILDISQLVARHSRFSPDERRPVVGRNAFTHTARLHQLAVRQDEMAYSWIVPSRVGRVTEYEPGVV